MLMLINIYIYIALKTAVFIQCYENNKKNEKTNFEKYKFNYARGSLFIICVVLLLTLNMILFN